MIFVAYFKVQYNATQMRYQNSKPLGVANRIQKVLKIGYGNMATKFILAVL
jgi:hypothetical protein